MKVLFAYPGLVTTSLNTRTASSFVMFSKFVSLTCNIISPGSILPSSATAPPVNLTKKIELSYKYHGGEGSIYVLILTYQYKHYLPFIIEPT